MQKVMELRLEKAEDYRETEYLTREAFWDVYRPGCSEHLVLHKLREAESFVWDLDYVAAEDGKIIGNIVYSRVFQNGEMCSDVIAFGPVSVHPEYQKKGIGKMLIRETLKKAGELGFGGVMITGSPEYYHQFGFTSADRYEVFLPGMEKEEAEFFMVKELEDGYFKAHAGIYEFDPCFNIGEEELQNFEKGFPEKEKREAREDDLA